MLRTCLCRRPSGSLCRTATLCMRFDRPNQQSPKSVGEQTAQSAHADPSTTAAGGNSSDERAPITPAAVTFKDLPESMRPKDLPPDFTPFPLPKYDESMGFGPVRLKNIPDVENARRRMVSAALREADDESDAAAASTRQLEGPSSELAAGATDSTIVSRNASASSEGLSGYRVGAGYPYIDRLECTRPLQDLLEQFASRPQLESRTATVLDVANSLARFTDAELVTVFSELSVLFAADGNGLQFIKARPVKFGRPYSVSSELTDAYLHLVERATELLVFDHPERLARSPALCVQLAHFLSLIKIFEPNRWFTSNPNQPSNRADYSHPRGVNKTIAHRGSGQELYDALAGLIASAPPLEAEDIEMANPWLTQLSEAQLVELLAGMAAVQPDGRPESSVLQPILRLLSQRCSTLDPHTSLPLLERLFFVLQMCDVQHDGLRSMLLSPTAGPTRGPDFFSAISRCRDPDVQEAALALLDASLSSAAADDTALRAALTESGAELLMMLPDASRASAFALRHGLDCAALNAVPHMSRVSRRLSAQQLQHQKAEGAVAMPASASYLIKVDGARVHPVRTYLRSHSYLSAMKHVLLLHSSAAERSVDRVLAACKRLRSGCDAMIVTQSCLRALATMESGAVSARTRASAGRALEVLAGELEAGRAVLLPVSEELRLHDAGTYCDEDLMLWTVAADMARAHPLVRCATLISQRSTAINPHVHLKGAHTTMATSGDVTNVRAPLLRALHGRELKSLARPARVSSSVRDRPSTVHRVNPTRAGLQYRRDRALFDKYHTHARHLAPGFSQGALDSDMRGLGYYTPDHPQVPFSSFSLLKHVHRNQS